MSRFILIILPLLLPLYVVRFHIGPLPTTLLELGLLGLVIVWMIGRGFDGWRFAFARLKKNGWLWPLIAWLAVGVISMFIAPRFVPALGLWRAYFFEPVIVFVMLQDLIRKDEDRRALARSVAAVLGALAVYAIIQFVTGRGIPHPWEVWPGRRATSLFPFPNALSLFSVPLAIWCWNLFLEHASYKGDRGRYLFLVGFIAGAISTMLAKSVGGMLALGAGLFIATLFHKKLRRYALGLALIGLVISVSVPPVRQTFIRQFTFQEWSGMVRRVMWKETWMMLKDHPVTGVGLGGYPSAIKPYHHATWMEIFQYPHTMLFNLWSEIGPLGIIVFIWILVLWWRRGRRQALPIIAALLVHGLVDVPYFKNDLAVMFWMLAAATSVLDHDSLV